MPTLSFKTNVTENFHWATSIPFEYELEETSLVSDEVRNIVEPVLWFMMLPLNIMGIITNTINIRVFLEQGVKNDSTNIGFLCLSLCDLLACAAMIPHSLCSIVQYTDGLAMYYTCTAFAIIFGYAHIAIQNMSTWTTVYISLIRSLCVVFPLKVKMMFTPRLTTIVITTIVVFFLTLQLLYSSNTSLEWIFLPGFNKTIAFIIDSPMARIVVYYHQLITNQICPALAVFIVSINSILMTRKLIEVKKWRSKNASNSDKEVKEDVTSNPAKKPMASKDVELIKFINTTAAIFLVCNLISFIPSVVVMVFPGVSFTGINKNLFYIVFFVRFLFDAVNSSINFFFYIRISSRYKAAFSTAFKTCLNQQMTEENMKQA